MAFVWYKCTILKNKYSANWDDENVHMITEQIDTNFVQVMSFLCNKKMTISFHKDMGNQSMGDLITLRCWYSRESGYAIAAHPMECGQLH
jgi:hypothetical protein